MKDRDHFDLMATTFIDGDASEAFFGDRWRMSPRCSSRRCRGLPEDTKVQLSAVGNGSRGSEPNRETDSLAWKFKELSQIAGLIPSEAQHFLPFYQFLHGI